MSPYAVVCAEQRTKEWFAARCGVLTGTCAADILARIKTGEAAARRDLRTRLVVERLTGVPQEDGFVSADMRRGTELEPEAFAAYEAATGSILQRVGFLRRTDLAVGCSPDGLIGNPSESIEGVVELKVPRSATHLRYLRAGGVPSEHAAQITHALFVTDALWCDFASFDPRFPQALQFYRARVRRADVDLKAYELLVRMFLAEVDREAEEVAAMAQQVAVA